MGFVRVETMFIATLFAIQHYYEQITHFSLIISFVDLI